MGADTGTEFDYLASEIDSDYDPLGSFEDDEDDDVESADGQLGPVAGSAVPHYKAQEDTRPASERITALFERLAPRKRVLFGILDFLNEPRRSDVLQEKVEELQKHDLSVYSGYSYSSLLYEAGAIERVEEDGSPFDESVEQAPDIVEIDGVRYYKPTDGKQVFWVITQDGLDFRNADNPYGRMCTLLEEDAVYLSIYERVLSRCKENGGASAQDMADMIDKDPLCEKPRRWSAYFTKKLEDCEALVWTGSWEITSIGEQALEMIVQASEDAQAGDAEAVGEQAQDAGEDTGEEM